MEMVWKEALRLASAACLVALAACSSGGGGSTALNTSPDNNNTNNNNNNNTNTTPANVAITAPDNPSSGGTAATGYNFSTNLPPVGTNFGLPGTVVKLTPTSFGGAGLSSSARSMDRATYEGVVTSNGIPYPVFDLSVPSLGFTASNVRGDGTTAATSNGGTVSAAIATLNYTLLGAWTYTPPGGGTGYVGQTATGFLTPDSAIPTSGTATYTGNSNDTGGVVGAYAVNTGNGTVNAGALGGSVSLTAAFGPHTISGTMTNMTATPAGGSASTPWNNVTISGSIGGGSPSSNNFSGTTAASAAPAGGGTAAFTSAAQGRIAGSFYGPNAQELGATWTLYESTNGGKSAFGTIAATATTP
jgi:hypothetical protein